MPMLQASINTAVHFDSHSSRFSQRLIWARQSRCKEGRRLCSRPLCQAGLKFHIRKAHEVAEYRAAAYLRAASFYTYPPDRSQYAARMHQRMKADTEWAAIEAKLAGADTDWKDLAVTCYIVTAGVSDSQGNATDSAGNLDPSTQLPGHGNAAGERVVGTLDLNQGLKLPSEELTGRLPEQSGQLQRAYLSNVCTAKAAQRQGVAAALIQTVANEGRQQGIRYLYVHVAQNNQAAKELYCTRCGFHEEQKENEGYARALGRPPRLLLCQALAA